MREWIQKRMRWRRDDGAVAIEFALVLPILVVLVFGIVQFGLYFNRQQGIHAAAREGARIAALSATTSADIEARVDDSLAGITLPVGRIILLGDGTDDDAYGAYYDADAYSQWQSDGKGSLTEATDDARPCEDRFGESVTVTVWVYMEIDFPAPYIADDTWIQGTGDFRCESN